jgi:hypothetical protein
VGANSAELAELVKGRWSGQFLAGRLARDVVVASYWVMFELHAIQQLAISTGEPDDECRRQGEDPREQRGPQGDDQQWPGD